MLETLSMTGITGELQVCHKLHLNSYDTSSFTLFTTSPFSIKGEVGRSNAKLLCQRL